MRRGIPPEEKERLFGNVFIYVPDDATTKNPLGNEERVAMAHLVAEVPHPKIVLIATNVPDLAIAQVGERDGLAYGLVVGADGEPLGLNQEPAPIGSILSKMYHVEWKDA